MSDEVDAVVELLEDGATYDELTDSERGPGLSKYKARRYVQEILPERGYKIGERRANNVGKKEFKIVEDNENYINFYEPQNRQPTQGVTREINDYLDQLESKIAELRNESDFEGLSSQGIIESNPGNQDIVMPRFDDHFGALIKDNRGNVEFDMDIAEKYVRKHAEHVLSVKEEREEAGIEFDGIHIILGGDIVTGENVYPGQSYDIQDTIDEQLARATKTYLDVVKTLADNFEFVQIVCVQGNHGNIKASGTSKQANVDRFLYQNLELLLAEGDYDNIGVVYTDRAAYTNFNLRGHNAMARHGENVKSHIGTARPEATWRSYIIEHEFDIAYRGHYHSHTLEHVNGRPVMLAPSIKPKDDHEEKLGYFSKPQACVHGASDNNPLEWVEYISFDE